jgi:hypothetical protein
MAAEDAKEVFDLLVQSEDSRPWSANVEFQAYHRALSMLKM